ncbi:purple acid phosphatase [Anaerovibrio sp. JC8]|uniref:purple acid phosphatase family protein n=1 Tax=Anaerovibrio sp. JC8 TaxID=1240085 RepID=UPI000A09C5AE|nr:metallophosphoesterase family protein [Anaerovibrio sp. JC8]ORU01297.1 purple acid phosphatase [Anaerovibrio sp. JC8]
MKATDKNTLSRRNFIKLMAGAGVMLAGGGILALRKTSMGRDIENHARSLLHDKQSQYLRQLITTDNAHSRRIMWQAAEPMKEPLIRLRLKKDTKREMVFPVQDDSFFDDGENHIQYSALLDNLAPDTAYEFAIEDGKEQTDWFPVQTADATKDDFTMLIFTDSQSSDYSDWRNVAQSAIKRHPEAELFTDLGDLVDNGEDSSQWRAWFGSIEGLIDRIPFVPVMGNHECYNRDWKEQLPMAYLHYFNVPDNHSNSFNRYYYSFDYGQVHFTVLNTMERELKNFKDGLMEEQVEWLHKDLSSTKKPWKIVLMHRDVLQYRIARRPERKEGISEEGQLFMPIFEQYGVDIVLTGHLHTYRNRGHIVGESHNDKGPLYLLCGLSGNVRYDRLWTSHSLDKVVAPQPETDNYLTMRVAGNSITIRCFLPDGTQLDEISVTK